MVIVNYLGSLCRSKNGYQPIDNDDANEVNVSNLVPSLNLEMTEQNDINADSNDQQLNYRGPKCWKYLKKHWPAISQPLALLIVVGTTWLLGRILVPDYTAINGVPTRMIALFIGAQLCGYLLRLLDWPEMLGMIGFGMFFANIGLAKFNGYSTLEVTLRDLALVNIMLLAGMQINLKALAQRFWVIVRLVLVPTIGEVTAIAILATFALQMPIEWSIMLGLVITAVSPNVVIDIVIWLKTEQLGLYKGIHTIIITMTSGNDVLSIFFFNVVLGMIFSTGTMTNRLLAGPIGIALGLVYGFIFGLLVCKALPSEKSKYANGLRFSMMVLGGMLSVLGSRAIGFTSAGALGCVVIAVVCSRTWQKPQHTKNNDVSDKLNLLWKFVKPISFALIGKEVIFSELDPKIVGYGVLIIVIGSCFRLVLAYASAMGTDLNWKERLYVTISSFPKATVQAALAPVALDLVRNNNLNENYEELAVKVLIVSVLAIVITAPLGAILMVKLASKFLQKSQLQPSP